MRDVLDRIPLLLALSLASAIGAGWGFAWWFAQERGSMASWAQSPCAGWAIAMFKPLEAAMLAGGLLAAGGLVACLALTVAGQWREAPWAASLSLALGGALVAFISAATEIAASVWLTRWKWLRNLAVLPVTFTMLGWPLQKTMNISSLIGSPNFLADPPRLADSLRVWDGGIAVAGPSPLSVKIGALFFALAIAAALACVAHWGIERQQRRALQGD